MDDTKQGQVLRNLEGRAAIVTGAGNGLGLAIARRLVAGGAKVLVEDIDPVVHDRVRETRLSGGSAFAYVADLAEDDSPSNVFRAGLEMLGHVDTLINNAAWSLHKPMLEMTPGEYHRLVAINQRAPYFLAQEFIKYLAQPSTKVHDPTIVNIASVNALSGNPNLVAYAGTKGALVAMTRALAVEMATYGARVNAISPSAVDTPMTQKVTAQGIFQPAMFYQNVLIKRLASCEEVADLVAYLCSPAATYVTGANWVIDGGYLAR